MMERDDNHDPETEDATPGITARDLVGAAFVASADAAVIVDAEGTIVLASPAVTALFGYRPEELAGRSVELLVPDEARELHATHRKGFVEASRARRMGSGLQLYGQTRDGESIPVDVSLAPIRVAGVEFSVALVRDAAERVRSMRQAEAVTEVSELLLGGAPEEDILALVINRARTLAEAGAAWVVARQPDGALRVVAADGAAERLLDLELLPTSRSGHVLAEGALDVVDLRYADGVPARIRALGLGPAVYVRLGHEHSERPGVLVVAREADERPFEDFDVNLVKVFAGATAVALRTGRTRRAAETTRLIAEQERIGSFLLGSSIQEAFQVGLVLAAVRPLATPAVAARLDEATARLDALIRGLRGAVFEAGGDRGAEAP